MKYSGRTTAYAHKHTKWGGTFDNPEKDYEQNPEYLTDGKLDWSKVPHDGKSAIQQETIFDVQWSDCPVEVQEEVKRLWQDNSYGNDHYYYSWDAEDCEHDVNYPIIHEYLTSKGVKQCLIHWWW